jgi:hypothetical protein
MKTFIFLTVVICIAGCFTAPSRPTLPTTPDLQVPPIDKTLPPVERAEQTLELSMQWIINVCAFAGVITFAAGFYFPLCSKLSGLFLIGALSAYAVLVAMTLLAFVKWLIIIAGATWVVHFIYSLIKKHRGEKDELEGIASEIITYFDDPEGEKKLSKKTQEYFTLNRPVRNKD